MIVVERLTSAIRKSISESRKTFLREVSHVLFKIFFVSSTDLFFDHEQFRPRENQLKCEKVTQDVKSKERSRTRWSMKKFA